MNRLVFSYLNPDLDGLSCSIAIEVLEAGYWQARILGALDAQSVTVLAALSLPLPPTIDSWSTVDAVWLVDTHHVRQLPADLPFDKVERITDHHPGGDTDRFPNARVQNEAVGAAATLVTEMFLAREVPIPVPVAILLQAAIVSNTLTFGAPATSHRDRIAYDQLRRIAVPNDELFASMERARRGRLDQPTKDIVRTDTKKFATAFGDVIVGQLECPGAAEVLDREDLVTVLSSLAEETACRSAVMNLVDTERGRSVVVATDMAVLEALSLRLSEPVVGKHTIHVARLLQRKTDVIPALLETSRVRDSE